jgi:Tat protein secretion system quality control protein TatD with DNase activity
MLPPDELNRYPLSDAAGAPINHPGNIALAYESLAEIRGIPLEELAEKVGENFDRLFVISLSPPAA